MTPVDDDGFCTGCRQPIEDCGCYGGGEIVPIPLSHPHPNGCEWNPDEDRPALSSDAHHRTTLAEVMVGRGTAWRLCSACAALPRFKRYRVRRPIAVTTEVRTDG